MPNLTTCRPDGSVATRLLTTDPNEQNTDTLRQQASTALAGNQTYLGLASPTNAQVAAQVRALTQQVDGLIRLAIGQLDATT